MMQQHSIQARCTITLDKLWQPAQWMPFDQIHHKQKKTVIYILDLKIKSNKAVTLGIPSDAKSMIHSIAVAWRVHFKGELAQYKGTKIKHKRRYNISIYYIISYHIKLNYLNISKTSILGIKMLSNCHFSRVSKKSMISSVHCSACWRFLWICEAQYLKNVAVKVMFQCSILYLFQWKIKSTWLWSCNCVCFHQSEIMNPTFFNLITLAR